MLRIGAIPGFVLLAVMGTVYPMKAKAATSDTKAFKIVNDKKLDAAVAEARAEFMKGKPFDRLDATILLPGKNGAWRRGSYNPDALAYPASCIKLAYLAAAMNWCRENGHPYDFLDHCVGPMIRKSDNVQTGVVVDAITSSTNIADLTTSTDSRFESWIKVRQLPANYLRDRGLLGHQTILHKTYPTNSGDSPNGAEKVAREVYGMNKLCPRLAASLMLEIAKGALEPGARDYMFGLLTHDKWGTGSVFGYGFPPGTKYYNKPGLAYDTLEDICYAVLPNGREFVLAGFSNSFRKPYSSDPGGYNSSQLGRFAELLIDNLGLTDGCPPKRVIPPTSKSFQRTGAWSRETTGTDKFARHYFKASPTSGPVEARWNLKAPETGKYEVCVWYTQLPENSKTAPFKVLHADGESTFSVNQQKVGGRWFRLGDFPLKKGSGAVVLSAAESDTTGTLVADTVKITKWPEN
ncbi:MAG: serine hydrolase [Candidatus Sumerlaeaceae bacterium]|nr:serine hydrolase [Candidatus Sumerlaeaceae bacterium]